MRGVTRCCRADKRCASASGSGRRRAPSGAVALASLKERRHPRLGGGCAALIRPTRTGPVGFVGGVASLGVWWRMRCAYPPYAHRDVGFVGGAASLVVVGRISAAHAPAGPKEAARPNAAGPKEAARPDSAGAKHAAAIGAAGRARRGRAIRRLIARASTPAPRTKPRKTHATNCSATSGRRSPVASALHFEHHRYGPERLITDAKEERTCLNP